MVESGAGGPWGKGGFALVSKMFLEAVEVDAGKRIARRDRAAGAGIAAFKMDFADSEADCAAFVFAEESVFPEGGNIFEFEGGAKALADVFERKAGEPSGNGFEGGGGDDGGAVGYGIVRETAGGITDDDLLLEEATEPLGSVFVAVGKSEGPGRDFASIGGGGESDEGEVGRVGSTDVVDEGSAFAIDPFAVDRIESPGAVESETTGRGDAGFGDGDGVHRFDGMEANVG